MFKNITNNMSKQTKVILTICGMVIVIAATVGMYATGMKTYERFLVYAFILAAWVMTCMLWNRK